MNTERKDNYALFKKYVDQTASEEETLEFMRFVSDPANELLIHHYLVAIQHEDTQGEGLGKLQQEQILHHIFQTTHTETFHTTIPTSPAKTIRLNYWMLSIAASLLLIIGYFTINRTTLHTASHYKQYTGILNPARDQATLTLENGKVITLTELPEGSFMTKQDLTVSKKKGGILAYIPTFNIPTAKTPEIHTLKTPVGGKYQLRLADGTRIWLNASTTISFPSYFREGESRTIKLEGEAYFEVAAVSGKSGQTPFLVRTKNQEVQVLGTHFNVQAYPGLQKTVTTLSEGSIKINYQQKQSRIIHPGEQATVSAEDSLKPILIQEVDTSMALAWKNGLFKFKNAGIKEVMNEFSRWYAIEVTYEGKIPDLKFNGEVYRDMNATQALKLLSMTNIQFRVVQSIKDPAVKKIIITGVRSINTQ